MKFTLQRRLAASMLGIGLHRVRISTDPAEQDNVLDAITREAVRELIRRHVITKRPVRGVSRGRARRRLAQRRKGRRRGVGSRKGAANARTPAKGRWMSQIRSLRSHLRGLKVQGRIDAPTYRRFYSQAKGGMFKSKTHLEAQLTAAGLLKEPKA